jgi:hypothetical protein
MAIREAGMSDHSGTGDEAFATGPTGHPGADLLSRLPKDVLDSLTAEQRAALWSAAHQPSWRRYPVNIRLSMPWFGERWFLTVVAGADRRNAERLMRERLLHPLRTAGNIAFLIGLVVLLHALAFGVVFLLSAVVEF